MVTFFFIKNRAEQFRLSSIDHAHLSSWLYCGACYKTYSNRRYLDNNQKIGRRRKISMNLQIFTFTKENTWLNKYDLNHYFKDCDYMEDYSITWGICREINVLFYFSLWSQHMLNCNRALYKNWARNKLSYLLK